MGSFVSGLSSPLLSLLDTKKPEGVDLLAVDVKGGRVSSVLLEVQNGLLCLCGVRCQIVH